MTVRDPRIREIVALIRKAQTARRPFYPQSQSIIKTIGSQPQPLGEDELPEAITSEDYDEWVWSALCNLFADEPRIQADPARPDTVECPRKRLLRIGEEAERDGTPSELFRYLMELTDNGAKLPSPTERKIRKAQQYLTIAIGFRQFVAENGSRIKNFKDLKCDFRKKLDGLRLHISESTLERALRAHDLNWSAYAIDAPRKGRRNPPANS